MLNLLLINNYDRMHRSNAETGDNPLFEKNNKKNKNREPVHKKEEEAELILYAFPTTFG